MVTGVWAPDDDVPGAAPARRDVRQVPEEVPRVPLADVAEPGRVGRTCEEVAEHREPRAVGRERERPAQGHGPRLGVMDPSRIPDTPPSGSDDLSAYAHRTAWPTLLHSKAGMALRVALVTPFAWSQPHDVNEHVAGLARELRARGHSVTVLAPSNRGRDLAAGRRALASNTDAELIALGPALPISRGSRMGVPVGVRANLAVALANGAFDVVHGFDPGLPSLSYLALRDSTELTAATFFSPEPLASPPGRAQRERLLGRLDALLATSEETAAAAKLRFPGTYELVPSGVDLALFSPTPKRNTIVLEWRQTERPLLKALVRELVAHPEWDLVLLRTRPLGGRPTLPRSLRGRVHVRTALDAETRAAVLRDASVFVPAFDGLSRVTLEAQAAGAAVSAPPGRALQPELAAAEAARLIEDDAFRSRRSDEGRATAELQSFGALADRVESVYASLERRRRPAARP